MKGEHPAFRTSTPFHFSALHLIDELGSILRATGYRLLPEDSRSKQHDTSDREENPVVVCVHGFMGHPANFRTLKKSLSAFALDVVCPRVHGPTHGFGAGLEKLSLDLEKQIDTTIADERPIIWVAHSMGGVLVTRILERSHALQKRTRAFVTLASPHFGTPLAKFLPLLREGKEQRPQEKRLYATDWVDEGIPRNAMSLAATYDTTVYPSETTRLGSTLEHFEIPTGHAGILFHEKTIEVILSLVHKTLEKKIDSVHVEDKTPSYERS